MGRASVRFRRVLVGLVVAPESPSIGVGSTQQFTAHGTYSDGSEEDVTAQVSWSSSIPPRVQISNEPGSKGLATAVRPGTAVITAGLSSLTDTTPVLVTEAEVLGLTVAPVSPSMVVGQTQQFTTHGTYSDGTEGDVTAQVTWLSLDSRFMQISNEPGSKGLATAVGVGKAEITAEVSSEVIDIQVLVTEAAVLLVAIVVAPESPSMVVGQTQQFTAHGTYSDGTEGDVTAQVSWSSSAPTVVEISNEPGSEGLATAVGGGTAEIGAALAGIVRTTPVPVTA
jgi:uncharacterized protein YjdB